MSEPHEVIQHPEALRGFEVDAVDGRVGVVIDATRDDLLVGRRLFRKRAVIPARAVTSIEMEDRRITLDRTRRQVAKIARRRSSRAGAWLLPMSNRIGASNPVVGVTPDGDYPDDA
jgi:hypothetical protein